MQAVVDNLEGQTLGSCHVERLLGQGRLSAVYLGQQAGQRTVAITAFLIPATFSAGARERFLSRFRREAQALVSLDHPHVLPIYEYGVQYGYPYLVTPYAADGSLANVLKQRGRCTPAFILQALQQIVAGLDYAHSRGVVHGTLKPANVLLHGSDERALQVAGFSLVRILEMRGIEQGNGQYAHLLNIAGTFLGTPEYSAPECVQGQPADARSDMYTLGILLFELLSGTPPFTGSDPLAVAFQHIQQPLPSLRALCPDLPPALEAVVNQALARDPAQRFQSGAELASAFARALSGGPAIASATSAQQAAAQPTKQIAATGNWQILPPVVTGHLPAVKPVPSVPEQATQAMPPMAAMPTSPEPLILPASPLLSEQDVDALAVDPFEWWSKTFTGHLPPPSVSASTTGGLGAAGTYGPARRPAARKPGMKRRQVVAALAAGGLLVAGFGGLSLAHMLENGTYQTTAGTTSTTGTAPGTKKTPTQGQVASNTTSTPTSQPTAKPTTKPTATPTHTQPTATPTSAPPTPTPTRSVPTPTPTPSHTGTVIGHTNQPTNTANGFTNPSDGHGSLLIHLPNGNFAAYEKACTHEGVAVYYDGGSHQLVCPAHGARFDPANGGSVLQGPANSPLPRVTIHVNGDGTITA